MTFDALPRPHCVVDRSSRLSPLHTFPRFPVWMGCTDTPADADLRQDMRWVICEDCGTIQLAELIPLDILYAHSHNSGVVGGLWAKHHQAFADFVLRQSPQRVLEIGGGHGLLSMLCHEQQPRLDWTILEPNPTPRAECKARYIKGFFDEAFTLDQAVDTVVHSHFLEHLYDPLSFLGNLQRFLQPGGRQVFSIPNLPVMLERYYTNCINFEHTYFVDETMLEAVMAQQGLQITAKEYFLDDHSIFYATERTTPVSAPLPSRLDINRQRYQGYLDHHLQLVNQLNSAMSAHHGPVYLFGGHVFSQYLIAFGLDTRSIRLILDNDPMKQGKRLSGTALQVASPKVLAGVDDAIVILRAGVYNAEIQRDILDNINPTVRFI